ncbi:hypothetical protein DWX28_05060 [Blautia sp. AF19-10LB]|nr:hypothetical protein DWX28_05060 [Blautia sp. AF19-10LB]
MRAASAAAQTFFAILFFIYFSPLFFGSLRYLRIAPLPSNFRNSTLSSHIAGLSSHFYAHIGAGSKILHPLMSKLMWIQLFSPWYLC